MRMRKDREREKEGKKEEGKDRLPSHPSWRNPGVKLRETGWRD
jgi:hypothetical protein